MTRHFTTLFFLLLPASSVLAVEDPQTAREDRLRSFLNSQCIKCHGLKVQEGDLALNKLRADFARADAAKTWAKVFEKVQLGEMPPEDEPQPEPAVRKTFLETLQFELAHAGIELDNERLLRPEFGNYVDHDKLFDGSITALPATVSRVWLNKNVSDSSPGEFRDFAALKRLDEATTQRDLREIEKGLGKIIAAIKENKRWLNGGYPMAEIVRSRHNDEDVIDLFGKTPASREVIEADVRRAFEAMRRPEPSDEQLAYYADFVQRVIEQRGNEAGFRALLMALALDPSGLYRSELGRGEVDEHGRRMLSAQEIEDAYAYRFGRNSLYRSNSEKLLHTREGIDQVARHILDSSSAMDAYRDFFRQYFGYTDALDVFKGERHARHHSNKNEMAAVLINELEAMIYRILVDDRDVLRRLLTTDRIFVTGRGVQSSYDRNNGITSIRWAAPEQDRNLIEKKTEEYRSDKFRDVADWAREHAVFDWGWHLVETRESNPLDRRHTSYHQRFAQSHFAYLDYYGLEPTQQDIDRFAAQSVELPPQEQSKDKPQYRLDPIKSPVPRAGVLTHPAWLLAKSGFDHSDVVRRGKWIREKLLGGTIPDVPIGVNAAVPPDEDKTLRERMEVTRDQYCWRCHVKMDPLGMPFETYDDFGRYRKDGKERRPDGEFVDLDASGEIIRSGEDKLDGEVKDAIDLMHKLADSERVRQVFVRHAFRFFLGRNETIRDSQTLIEADRAYVESDGSFKALVHSLITSDSFLYRVPPSGKYELAAAKKDETATEETENDLTTPKGNNQ